MTTQQKQQSLMAEGIWPCLVLSASSGEDDKGSPQVQINVKITDGPSAGRQCTYEDQINAKSALYVARSMKAVGWKGGESGDDPATLHDDVEAWIKATGGKSTVEIKHLEIGTGKRAGQIWDKPNAIGRGPRVLKDMSDERKQDAREALRSAMTADGSVPDDANGDGTYGGAPADDIPFATCSSVALGEIAKVLR